MRFSILLPLLSLSLLPSTLSSPAAAPAPVITQAPRHVSRADTLSALGVNENTTATMTILGGGVWPPPSPSPQCQGDPTRYDDTCQCHEGFVEPKNPLDTCCCGDQKNTLLVLEGCQTHGCNEAVCMCKPKHSWYHIRDKKCVCDRGYVASFNKNGKLKCSAPASTSLPPPVGSGGVQKKRAIFDAIQQRKYDETESQAEPGALEKFLDCGRDQMACEVDGSWSCTDMMSSLSSCGACYGIQGADCGSLPGVDAVRCDTGRCVIDSCLREFTRESVTRPQNSTLPSHVCTPKRSETSWLKIQNGDEV